MRLLFWLKLKPNEELARWIDDYIKLSRRIIDVHGWEMTTQERIAAQKAIGALHIARANLRIAPEDRPAVTKLVTSVLGLHAEIMTGLTTRYLHRHRFATKPFVVKHQVKMGLGGRIVRG